MQEKLARLFKNRGAALVAGVAAALLGIILLVAYLHSYRSSVNSGKQLERVVVAKKLIEPGTSGDLIAKQSLYQVTEVQKDQLKPLAISDPAAIQGRVAASIIYPGAQLTQDQFTTESAASIPYEISGPQRAISVAIDSTHDVGGQVASGNFVDIYVSMGSTGSAQLVKLLAANVYVLVAPPVGGGNAVLRIKTQDAAKFAEANDYTKLWFVLRPQVGASKTPPVTATLASLGGSTTGG